MFLKFLKTWPELKTILISFSPIYRESTKFFPDYKHLLRENYVEYEHFFKCNSTQEVFLQPT
jgi:hypothetical protein